MQAKFSYKGVSSYEEASQDQDSKQEPATPKPKSTRQRSFSSELERVRVELPLADVDKQNAQRTFFAKVKEELEYIPAKLRVLEYWQEKSVFSNTDGSDTMRSAPRSTHPLGKCIASPSLLAYIIVSKYADGLPLYRLENMFKRCNGDISRANMAHWVIRLEDVFKPIINLLREVQNSSHYLQADETRIQVLKEPDKTAQSDKWMWVIRGGPPDQPSVLFNYDSSRAGAVIEQLLTGFSGVLQADGYVGYDKLCRQPHITRIGCMDHARRKFVEATKASKTAPKNKKLTKAQNALNQIGKLYAIERKIKHESHAERYRARQAYAIPVLNKLKEWLEKNLTQVLKGGLTYKAIQYTLNQWEYLIGYCEDGQLAISNVLAENAIRPFAVDRKAWLFADTPRGARASATCYSLIETAKSNQLEPYAYIHYVLQHIGDADTVEKFEALLPWNVPLKKIEKKVPAAEKV